MIEAVITVVSCDRCGKIISLQSDADYEDFEARWFDGVVYSYCPDCRLHLPNSAGKRTGKTPEFDLNRIF